MSLIVFLDIEIIADLITFFFYHVDDSIQFFIQKAVLLLCAAIDAVILNGDGIRQFIVSKQFSIAVKNIASGAGSNALFSNQKGIIIQIFLPLYYLKHKNALQQYAKQKDHHHAERK